MLNYGATCWFYENYGIREANGCSRTPPGAMLRRPFRCRRSFMYSAVSDINYIAESDASWEKKSGSVAKLWGPISSWLLRNFDSNVKTRAEPMGE